MKSLLTILALIFVGGIAVTGCSVVGQNDVESAPYSLLESDETLKIEVRNYDSMVLVSTDMSGENENRAFRKLFKYITGDNEGATEISMTAPVFMGGKNKKGTEISMTAPVFMNENAGAASMSFVMPSDFTLATTPKPSNPDVWVSEVKDYKVAVIQFSGTLSDKNVEKHTNLLSAWIIENSYTPSSEGVKAGYNGPMTLPMWRRNEILIEVM